MKDTDELVTIAAAGGGFRLDASGRSVHALVTIAAAASRHGATVIMEGIGRLSQDELVRIAAAGEGAVRFDVLW